MGVARQKRHVKRYFIKGEFNPASSKQILSVLNQGGSHYDSSNKKVLEQLAKKDPLFKDVLDFRAIGKVRGTYCDGIESRLGKDDRLHAETTHRPSTMRLSMRNPNLQNVVADKKEASENPAAGFRKCVVATEGASLLEADFSAIEALLVGWLIKDPNFMRLARLGIHGWHASHILGKPIDLKLPDEQVGKLTKAIKAANKVQYDKSKITIYGSLYAQSPWGLQKTYPEIFETVADAARNQEFLFQLCPKLKQWHSETQLQAHKNNYLGLEQHPFKFRHWFWDVYSWDSNRKQWRQGKDAKRVLAYGPQSIGFGILSGAATRIAPRIEHCFFGKTPLRALIHDSILGEVEDRHLSLVQQVMKEEMTKPVLELPCPPEWGFGPHLSIGVEIKVGKTWADMKPIEEEIGVASDTPVREFEEEEEEVA